MDFYHYSNGISDSWLDACHVYGETVFEPLFSAFKLVFHFDSLNWILLELLFLLPVFFRLYGYGVQQKLTRFYDETRHQLIHFMFLFGMSTVVSSSLQLIFNQAPACVSWDGTNYHALRDIYSSPNLDLAVITILMIILSSVVVNMWIERRHAPILQISLFIMAIGFYVILFCSAFWSGTININQAVLSVALGAWLYFFFRFVPPLFIPLLTAILMPLSLILFISVIKTEGKESDIVARSVVPGIRGCIVLVINMALYWRYVQQQDNFRWMNTQWNYGGSSPAETEIAVIPGVISREKGTVFGMRLNSDIRDGAVAFVAVLLCNEFISDYFDYALFSVN